jgi:hypothetical protein
VASIASAGTPELETKVTSVNHAKMIFDRFAKKRKERLIMTPPMDRELSPQKARKHYASKVPAIDGMLTTGITEI